MYDDVFFNPVFMGQLIDITARLLGKGQTGIFNVSSDEKISKYEFSCKVADIFGFDPELIQPIQASRIRGCAERPMDMSLSNKSLKLFYPTKICHWNTVCVA